MKQKAVIMLMVLATALPLSALAAVSVNISTPGISVHIGDRNDRGYYWDGYDWRPPVWWRDHQGKHIGERSQRGEYWDGGRWTKTPPKGHGDAVQSHPEPASHTTPKPNAAHSASHAQPERKGAAGQSHGDHNEKKQENGGQPIKPPQRQ